MWSCTLHLACSRQIMVAAGSRQWSSWILTWLWTCSELLKNGVSQNFQNTFWTKSLVQWKTEWESELCFFWFRLRSSAQTSPGSWRNLESVWKRLEAPPRHRSSWTRSERRSLRSCAGTWRRPTSSTRARWPTFARSTTTQWLRWESRSTNWTSWKPSKSQTERCDARWDCVSVRRFRTQRNVSPAEMWTPLKCEVTIFGTANIL